MKETDIVREICEHLAARGLFFWRNIANPTPGRGMPKWWKKGQPDIVLVLRGRYIGIEVKRPAGLDDEREPNGRRVRERKLSLDQQRFALGLEAAGGLYIIAHSWREVLIALPPKLWG